MVMYSSKLQVLADKLKQVRQVIKKTEDMIKDVSLGLPE
jgi:hypothetical protein